MADKVNDKDRCFMCESCKSCGIDKFVPTELGGRDIRQNMILTCNDCHDLVTNSFDTLEKIMFSPDGLSGDDSPAARETRLLCLSLIRLIATWAQNPDEAHDQCKNIVHFWSSPYRHKVKRNHGVFVDEFSECYNPGPMFRRPDVDSLHDILTKIRELKKQGVPNNLIMSVLKEIKPDNQNSKKKLKRHDDSNQKSLLDPPDE